MLRALEGCGLAGRAPDWDYHQFFPPGWVGGDVDKEVCEGCNALSPIGKSPMPFFRFDT